MGAREDVDEDADEHVARKRRVARRADRDQIPQGRPVDELGRDREVTAHEIDVLDPRDVGVPVRREALRVAQEEPELLGRQRGDALRDRRPSIARVPPKSMDHDEVVRFSDRRVRTLRARPELTQDSVRRDA